MKTLRFKGLDTGRNTVVEVSQRNYLDTVALGFFALTQGSSFFKKWLTQRLLDRDLVSPGVADIHETALEYENIEWAPPINPAVAEPKLAWLFNEIDYAPERQKQRVVEILNLACGNIIMPQMAAWGIAFVETLSPRPSGHPFRFTDVDYSQVVILGPGWNLLKPQDLTRKVSRASSLALSRCVEEACFKLDRLEPEVSSWLLEGSGVRLYSAESDQHLKDVLDNVRESGLPFASISEEVDMLALQPCITGSYDTLLAELIPLD